VNVAPPLELRGPFLHAATPRFYLRNVSCGVFAGDAYDIKLRAGEGARAFVSGTSATKVHAMPTGSATSAIRIESSPDAVLAYYDGPTILQGDSDFAQRAEIVAGDGLAIYAEVLVLGRMARDETLAFRRYRSEVVVRDMDGRPLYVERYELDPERDRAWVANASLPVLGKVICAGAGLESTLEGLDFSGDDLIAGWDQLPSNAGLVVRAASDRLEPVSRIVELIVSAMIQATGPQPALVDESRTAVAGHQNTPESSLRGPYLHANSL
jgi:urease accessory protein UreH